MANQYGYVCGNLIVGILQLNLVLSPSFSLFFESPFFIICVGDLCRLFVPVLPMCSLSLSL